MERNKKNFAMLVLSFALMTSGVVNIYFLFGPMSQWAPIETITLTAGVRYQPWNLDPMNSKNTISRDVIEQVCEGLYMYNLSDPDLGIISILASGSGSWDVTGKHFTIPLRRNVWFHDGTPFNATAVKWNFERINWFINASGTLNNTLSQIHYLYELPNGTTIFDPINPVTINSEFSVTINLREQYAILESLLCHESAYILSPKATPKYEYINKIDGKIVGTGPFVYDHYIDDTEIKANNLKIPISEIKFHRWVRYWRTGAYFEELTISIFYDSSVMINAIIAQSIDYLLGTYHLCVFCELPTTTHSVRGLSDYYLVMNNKKINQTWRKAISYAINYSYIIDELQDGTAYRSNGPLAPDFPGYNESIKAATCDIARARQILVDAGITNLIANNDTTGSVADAWKAADFQSWNYSYNVDNDFRADLGVLLRYYLDLIGINVIDQPMSWSDFINRAYGNMGLEGYNSLDLYWIGCGSDYLSPYNMIASLFSNNSVYNAAQYHNDTLEMWLDEVLSETNVTKREILFSKILHQIVEVDMPYAFGYHPYQGCTHSKDLKNVPYNSLLKFDARPIYRESNS